MSYWSNHSENLVSEQSKNPEILSNLIPNNQINGVDETASVTVGFDWHDALI